MPFLINNVDNFLLAVELTVKVCKFLLAVGKVLAKVLHWTALFIGGALIFAAYWAVECHAHITGKTQTFAAIAEAKHGELEHAESAEPITIEPKQFISAPASQPSRQEWVLEDAIADIAPVARKEVRRKGKRRAAAA
jgi:hypothetical protein